MTTAINVIVTGANRGIGRAICEAIFKGQDLPPLHLHACSRSEKDLGLSSSDGARKISYHKLDITNDQSITALLNELTAAGQKVDVVINNAGVNLDRGPSLDTAQRTLNVNYWGTLKMCQSFIPHLPAGGRIVNISSIASVLKLYKEEVRDRFRAVATLADVDRIAHDYLACVKDGTEEAAGFGAGGRSYNVSKALLNAATRILAQEHNSLVINSCCPGWIDTDMGILIGKPTKTLEQGTTIPLRLAFGDLGGVSGRFWANSSVSSTEAGQPQRW